MAQKKWKKSTFLWWLWLLVMALAAQAVNAQPEPPAGLAQRWPSEGELGLAALPEGWESIVRPADALPMWAQRPTFRSAARYKSARLVLAVEPPESDLVRADRMRGFVNRGAAELQGVPGIEVWRQEVVTRPGEAPVGVIRLKIARHMLPAEVGGAPETQPTEYLEQVNLFVADDSGLGALYLYRPWEVPQDTVQDPLLAVLIAGFSPPASPPLRSPEPATHRWWMISGGVALLILLGLWRYTHWQRKHQRTQSQQRSTTAPPSMTEASTTTPSPAWEGELEPSQPHPKSPP